VSRTELRCGCRLLNNACVISPRCTAGHSETNRPGGPVVPTPKQAQKRAEARGSGRKLQPGRYRWSVANGDLESVVVDENTAVARQEAQQSPPTPGLGISSTDAAGGS
jgi:hypothetical protein